MGRQGQEDNRAFTGGVFSGALQGRPGAASGHGYNTLPMGDATPAESPSGSAPTGAKSFASSAGASAPYGGGPSGPPPAKGKGPAFYGGNAPTGGPAFYGGSAPAGGPAFYGGNTPTGGPAFYGGSAPAGGAAFYGGNAPAGGPAFYGGNTPTGGPAFYGGNATAGGPPFYGSGRSFCPCCGCKNEKDKNDGHTTVLVAILAMMGLLAVAFLATVLFVFALFFMKNEEQPSSTGTSGSAYGKAYGVPEMPMDPGIPNAEETPDAKGKAKTAPYTDEGVVENPKYYGVLGDEIRTDLAYSIEWENYDYKENDAKTVIWIDYPQIQGEMPNKEAINELIAKEITYFEEYYEEYSKYMLEGESFSVYSLAYVTYMDEKTMSVVFEEEVSTDYWSDRGLYCINIDVEDGVVVENTSILDIDDAFAVDFRIRSREQNGESSVLDYMTDQEISYYLTASDSAIVFYTPLGLEVGMNYGENYVTVTYDDYEKYVKKY